MKKIVFSFLFLFLIYTRFVGLDWGLPYLMHPDERNMAVAVTEISLSKIYSPNFWAYGGFQINIAFFLTKVLKIFTEFKSISISFEEAVISLRTISAFASIITAVILMKIAGLLIQRTLNRDAKNFSTFYLLFFIFQPYFVQFSHFGTTESLLMLFYSLIIYYSLKLIDKKKLNIRCFILLSVFSGLAIATKVSSIIFSTTAIIAICFSSFARSRRRWLGSALANIIYFLIISLIVSIIFSPHYLSNWKQFKNSLLYEKSLAIGGIMIFYTRQFINTIPIWFQSTKIFPYVLGIPQYIMAIAGFLFLSWRKKEINLLRFTFLVYFIPNGFLYTKWTRFMTPVFPVISIFAVLFLFRIINHKSKILSLSTFFILTFSLLAPGLAYLSVFQNPDVRFTASEWIYKNISLDSYILSETANVVDIPIVSPKSKVQSQKSYQVVSFNFYDLDEDVNLQNELKAHLQKADYIFIPSRRIFKNHTAKKYPRLNNYYQKLFSGELGFKKVAEFTSYPKISLFGKTLIEFPDENAEETWSVFDHPVVRIYKKL